MNDTARQYRLSVKSINTKQNLVVNVGGNEVNADKIISPEAPN